MGHICIDNADYNAGYYRKLRNYMGLEQRDVSQIVPDARPDLETENEWTFHPFPSGGGYYTKPVDPEIVAQMPTMRERTGLFDKLSRMIKNND